MRHYLPFLAICFFILSNLEFNHDKRIYNLGKGNGYSLLKILNTYQKVNNLIIKYKIGPRRSIDISISYADNFYVLKDLNWDTKLNLEDMCRDSYNKAIHNYNKILSK